MKIAISAETTVDLTEQLLIKYDIKIVPFNVLLGEKSGYDGEINGKEIIDYVNEYKVLPKTSAVNENQFEQHFTNLLKDYDAVIHFSLSEKLSSAYNNAKNVAKKMKNVFVIDSASLSTGIALLAIYARKLADNNYTPEKICKMCTERIPSVQASFVLKRLDYLYKGGRCSALALFGANLLKIRPQILLKDGKMISGKKYRGNFSHVVSCYVTDTLEKFDTPDYEQVFITYTTADDDIINSTYATLKEAGFKNINSTIAGGTVTSHCGENTLGILYFNDGPHPIKSIK